MPQAPGSAKKIFRLPVNSRWIAEPSPPIEPPEWMRLRRSSDQKIATIWAVEEQFPELAGIEAGDLFVGTLRNRVECPLDEEIDILGARRFKFDDVIFKRWRCRRHTVATLILPPPLAACRPYQRSPNFAS